MNTVTHILFGACMWVYPTYWGADNSLARPTSQCICLMVRISLLMLVLLYLYIVLIFLQL